MISPRLLAERLSELFGPCRVHAGEETTLRQSLTECGFDVVGKTEVPHLVVVRADYKGRTPPYAYASHARFVAVLVENGLLDRRVLASEAASAGYGLSVVTFMATPFELWSRNEAFWLVFDRNEVPRDLDVQTTSTMAGVALCGRAVKKGDRAAVFSRTRGESDLAAVWLSSFAPGVRVDVPEQDVDLRGKYDLVLDLTGAPEAKDLLRPAGVLFTVGSTGHGLVADPLGSEAVFPAFELKRFRAGSLGVDAETDLFVGDGGPPALSSIAQFYENPRILYGIVGMDCRIRDRAGLIRECENVLASSRPFGPDAGAALCVLSYAISGFAVDDGRVNDFIEREDEDRHSLRWRISLCFVMAENLLADGRRGDAEAAYHRCLSLDAAKFHPSIMTKQMAAVIRLCEMAAARGDLQSLRQVAEVGVELGRKVVGVDSDDWFGKEAKFFYFGECGEIVTAAARVAFILDGAKGGDIDVARRAIGASADLFKRQRRGDRRDIELQRHIIAGKDDELNFLRTALARSESRSFARKAIAMVRRLLSL